MKGKKVIAVLLCTASVLLTACGGQQDKTDSSANESKASSAASGKGSDEAVQESPDEAAGGAQRVALIVNQRFGDQSSVDIIAAGVDKAAEEFGLEVKKLESTSTASHEDDIRSLAREGMI